MLTIFREMFWLLTIIWVIFLTINGSLQILDEKSILFKVAFPM